MQAWPALLEMVQALADFLFPPACILCGAGLSGHEKLCRDCHDSVYACALEYSPPARIIEQAVEIAVLLPYHETCRTLVHAFKYHGMPSVAYLMGNLMARKSWARFSKYPSALLVPVPLHPLKLKERGYNQSLKIAEGFASFTGHEIGETLLSRRVYTGTQTALGQEERRRNVQGAFAFSGETALRDRPVILIDDVLTTGSTLAECTRTLKDGGAGDIAICVVATPDVGDS
ncbi:MAG: ComF family protein [Candidatus Latescibacter sp.]|nr:ComF family protein [Candidatus Latescibacter sp.]